MKTEQTDRGFRYLMHDIYGNTSESARLISESSAIGNYKDSMSRPGSSFLWVGEHHHLNREEVNQLVDYMNHWLQHKRLPEA
jgi:hypothetical protein